MIATAITSRTPGRIPRRGIWRLRGQRPVHEDFQLCLALLDAAIARAERWCARRERALADFDLRAADMVNRLRDAGMVGPSTRWPAA